MKKNIDKSTIYLTTRKRDLSMHNYITKKVLGFKDENIKILDFIEKKENITIKIELKRVDHGCPRCGFTSFIPVSSVASFKTTSKKFGLPSL